MLGPSPGNRSLTLQDLTERRRNGGKSKYARGERRTLKLEQQRTKAVAEAEKEIAQEKKEREQAVQAAFGAVPSQEKGGALVDSRLLKSAAEQQPQPKVAPAKTKLVDLSPQEFRSEFKAFLLSSEVELTPESRVAERAADAAAKRQEESKAKGSSSLLLSLPCISHDLLANRSRRRARHLRSNEQEGQGTAEACRQGEGEGLGYAQARQA